MFILSATRPAVELPEDFEGLNLFPVIQVGANTRVRPYIWVVPHEFSKNQQRKRIL